MLGFIVGFMALTTIPTSVESVTGKILFVSFSRYGGQVLKIETISGIETITFDNAVPLFITKTYTITYEIRFFGLLSPHIINLEEKSTEQLSNKSCAEAQP